MIKTATILFICFFFLTSFNFNEKHLQIRFKNSTGKDFKELKVWTIDGYIILHNLKNGETSDVFLITSSYKFTYANVITEYEVFTTPGFCRTGEKNYSNGEMLMDFKLTSETYKNSPKENPYLFIKTTINGEIVQYL